MSASFERGFTDAERSATAVAKAASSLSSAARQMQKAAQQGDIGKLRRAVERLAQVAEAARQDVANARAAWPFSEEGEKEYLRTEYEQELFEEAAKAGLSLQRHDNSIIAFPSVLKISPSDLSVRVDRKRVAAVRPSYLARTLLERQKKSSKYPVERFMEALHSAYKMIAGKDGNGTVVLLNRVYQAFTLQPGSSSEYDKSDFTRDLFLLDRSGLTQTRSGARLALPASTGTKSGGTNVLTFVAPDGEVKSYYGLQFIEGAML